MSPIQTQNTHSVNSLADTTLQQAQLNTRFAAEDQIARWNESRIVEYESAWKDYVAARDARPDATNLIMPVPARAEAVYTDGRGWPYIDASDKPVIAPHTYVAPALTPRASLFGAAPAVNAPPIIPDVGLGNSFWFDGRQYVRII